MCYKISHTHSIHLTNLEIPIEIVLIISIYKEYKSSFVKTTHNNHYRQHAKPKNEEGGCKEKLNRNNREKGARRTGEEKKYKDG